MPKLTKADISNPTNFQHISGIDTETGGGFNLNDDLTPKTEPNECDKTSKNMVRIIQIGSNFDYKIRKSFLCN